MTSDIRQWNTFAATTLQQASGGPASSVGLKGAVKAARRVNDYVRPREHVGVRGERGGEWGWEWNLGGKPLRPLAEATGAGTLRLEANGHMRDCCHFLGKTMTGWDLNVYLTVIEVFKGLCKCKHIVWCVCGCLRDKPVLLVSVHMESLQWFAAVKNCRISEKATHKSMHICSNN